MKPPETGNAETTWTPGPWAARGYQVTAYVNSTLEIVASIHTRDFDEGEANARLIAEAPAMADVLRTVLANYGRDLTVEDGTTIRAILRRLEGKP